jgi:integrase
VGLLGAIFTYAERKGMVDENPVRGVVRFADGKRERRLSDAEYAMLGKGLETLSAVTAGEDGAPDRVALWPAAAAAIRFLAITGWRSGEATGLRWGAVDLARKTAVLKSSKTGESIRPLSTAACDLLRGLGPGALQELVFPPARGSGAMSGFRSYFDRVGKAGGLPEDVTPHVLRHAFMSLGNDLGFTEATIGMLCGHKGHGGGGITRGYIHAGDALFVAADRIASGVLRKIGGEGRGEVVDGPGAKRLRA